MTCEFITTEYNHRPLDHCPLIAFYKKLESGIEANFVFHLPIAIGRPSTLIIKGIK